MGRFAPIITFLCSLTFSTSLQNRSDYRVLRLSPSTSAQEAWVRDLRGDPSLDFWSVFDVMVDSNREKTLKQQLDKEGIACTTLISNVQDIIDAERDSQQRAPDTRDGVLSFNKFLRYDEMFQQLQTLASKHPTLVGFQTIGNSSLDRHILLIKISTGGGNTRPLIVMDAGIHAREWLAPATALYIIRELVENPGNADLISEVDWHIIPLLNPDGYEYTHTNDRMWRKSRSNHTCKNDSQSGVDLNRNFDLHWNEVGASNDPCDESYAGPSPFSEPESRALRDHVLKNAARTKLYVTLHTYGKYLLYPWGYTFKPADDCKKMDEVAIRARNALPGSHWKVGSSAKSMYPAAGGSDDWVKGAAGVSLTYTVELQGGDPGGFSVPESSLPQAVASFFPAVRVFGQHVADPYYESDAATMGAILEEPLYWLIIITILT